MSLRDVIRPSPRTFKMQTTQRQRRPHSSRQSSENQRLRQPQRRRVTRDWAQQKKKKCPLRGESQGKAWGRTRRTTSKIAFTESREHEGKLTWFTVVDSPPKEGAKEKEVVETKFLATPSVCLPKTMVTSPIQVDDVEELPARSNLPSSQAAYMPV